MQVVCLGNQPWIFIGRTDVEAEAPIFWLPDAKSRFIGKDPDAGKDWGQEEKGVTKNEMVGWQQQISRHECDQNPGEGQENWHAPVHGGSKELDTM